MAVFKVEGGRRLSGEITPQGAKNEALQILCATLLTKEEVVALILASMALFTRSLTRSLPFSQASFGGLLLIPRCRCKSRLCPK